jgi:molybdopterin synthase sulfur carrier subunit
MKIHIRYFASLRETTGRGAETLDIPIGASVLNVRTELIARYPDLQPIMQRCISALNRRYVDSETMLQDGDELVFIPPMGGGGDLNSSERRG